MRMTAVDQPAGTILRDRQVAAFDALDPQSAGEMLSACCAADRWVAALTAGRPYATAGRLYEAAAARLAALDWPDIRTALAAHPRIGRNPAGRGQDAEWSRGEQAQVRDAAAPTAAALAAVNEAYEAKFGFVFLIRAAGRTGEQILAAATQRLGQDELTEQASVREELGQIIRLRLDRLLDGMPAVSGKAGSR